MTIYFYSTKDAYGEFSNFAAYPISLDGACWPTTEHYFQAQKFDDEDYREKIRNASSPMVAADLGRSRKVKLRDDWESMKIDVMRQAVRSKFDTYQELSDLLLSTGDEEIVEAARGDSFWGYGADGLGTNWLGRILTEIREELRHRPSSRTP